jgi:hypothetical protein
MEVELQAEIFSRLPPQSLGSNWNNNTSEVADSYTVSVHPRFSRIEPEDELRLKCDFKET